MDNYQEKFRAESLKQLQELKSSDILLFDNKPIQENITIILRPDNQTLSQIQKIIVELKILDPHQYYYPPNTLHLTLLGGLKSTISPDTIWQALTSTVSKETMKFNLKGLGSNKHAASVAAYPLFPIYKMRKELRSLLGDVGDDYTIHLPIYEHIGWFNILRYLQTPTQDFLSRLYSYKDQDFGTMTTDIVEVYRTTSKILQLNQSQLLYSC